MEAAQHPRAFVVRFRELSRWDPASYHGMTWYWPTEVLKPIGSLLRARKTKIDLRVTAFEQLQPLTVHFDGSVSRRQAKREYSLQLFAALPGDLVVSKIDLKNGALGFVPQDWANVAVTGHFAVYELDHNQVLPAYFRRVVQSPAFKNHLWRNKVGAEGRKEVKLDFFEQQLIPLPTLAIQKAIVDRWEEGQQRAQELEAGAEQGAGVIAQKIYRALGSPPHTEHKVRSRLVVLPLSQVGRWSVNYLVRARAGLLGFTESDFDIVALDEVLLDTENGYSIRPTSKATPYKMLKLNALGLNGLDVEQSKYVSVPEKTANRFSLKRGDLLICRSVGSYEMVAKCAVVEQDEPSLLFPDIIIRARLDSRVLPEYVREVIQTPLGRSYFQSNARTAVGMWKIGAEDIRNFPLPLPPLELQHEIVRQVAEARAEVGRLREEARRVRDETRADVEAMILGTKPVLGA